MMKQPPASHIMASNMTLHVSQTLKNALPCFSSVLWKSSEKEDHRRLNASMSEKRSKAQAEDKILLGGFQNFGLLSLNWFTGFNTVAFVRSRYNSN